MKDQAQEVMDKLLELYDWHIRRIDESRDEYQCGYADAIGQAILDVGAIFGEGKWNVEKQEFELNDGQKYKYEAYKRVMQFEGVEKYKKQYPKPLSPLQEGK